MDPKAPINLLKELSETTTSRLSSIVKKHKEAGTEVDSFLESTDRSIDAAIEEISEVIRNKK